MTRTASGDGGVKSVYVTILSKILIISAAICMLYRPDFSWIDLILFIMVIVSSFDVGLLFSQACFIRLANYRKQETDCD